MKKFAVIAALAASLIPLASLSASAKTANPVKYQCAKCHMKFSAATAKADHYKDPMDGGTLVPMKPAAKHAKPMGKMSM